ncbi:MAG TPA: D-glycero-beta-D-manno-heptose 1-phosphate adenylyltransferase [Bacteroidales bacterium]|nr:D-glycero-beta-D-manno-heptose 1-phosphate adenylyltransferase [Bacteroidales bacterium]
MDYLEHMQTRIVGEDHLNPLLTYWRLKDQKIVFTNGCFDILHRGHVEYLAKAASLGDILFVGINSDQSVRKLKGDERPVQDEYSRALLTASMRFVTAVMLFDEDTPYRLIERIQPDVLVKGGDYQEKDIVGADLVRNKGGKVVPVDYTDGYSSSKIIEKIQQFK